MENDNLPLIVDLDHTLIDTDLLFLSSLGVLTKRPWLIGHYLFWLSKGKGFLKDQLVRRFEINIPDDAAEKIQTVGQAVEFIENNQG